MNKQNRQLVSDDMLSRLTQKISSDMLSENVEEQEHIDGEDIYIIEQLYEEIQKLKGMIRNLSRNLKNVVREEIEDMFEGKTLITEGSGDEVHLILKGHHFKGNMKPVAKKK